MNDQSNFYADAAMLIRRPVHEVFNAFIDPDITAKFWFTHGSGKLEKDKVVIWKWEMYHHSVPVKVIDITNNEKIRIQWGDDTDAKVEWTFKPMGPANTFVTIKNTGFKGSVNEIISQIRDATGGFSWVLSGLKAYLEFNVELNLIADRYPGE